MKLRCAIVDDEELARRLLEQYISKIPEMELVGSYKSPLLLTDLLSSGSVDLLLLDIQMPDITGTDFLRSLQIKPVVIITTAYPEHALEGYELDVLDYLVKPIPFERFYRAVQKAISYSKPGIKSGPAATQEDRPPAKDYLAVNADHKIYKIKFNNILYVEGLREYVSYYTTEGQRIIALESLKKLEELLPANFMRIHKSYIVPLDKVKIVEGNMVHIADKKLPIGASYREEVMKKLFEG